MQSGLLDSHSFD